MKTTDLSDFRLFLEESSSPPLVIENELFQTVHTALHPNLYLTLIKLFGVCCVGSFMTLVLCPQFGVGISSPISLLTDRLMAFHPALCFLTCGSIWACGGQGLISTCLTIDEKRVVNKYQLGTILSQISLTILVFGCLGYVTFDQWLIWWVLGAVVTAASLILYLNMRMRRAQAFTLKAMN